MVRAVDHVQETLIGGKRQARRRTREQRLVGDESFLHERAVLLEYLDAVVGAVGDIHEAVLRDRDIVRQAELLHGRRIGIVRAEVFIVGLVPVRAPHTLEGERTGVEDEDPMVSIAIGDVKFVVHRIDGQIGGAPRVLRVGVPSTPALMAELGEELSLSRELENLRILVSTVYDPLSLVEPWHVANRFVRVTTPNLRINMWSCEENNNVVKASDGGTQLILKGEKGYKDPDQLITGPEQAQTPKQQR